MTHKKASIVLCETSSDLMHCYLQFDKNSTQNYTAQKIYQVMMTPEVAQVCPQNKSKKKVIRKTGIKGNRSNQNKKNILASIKNS